MAHYFKVVIKRLYIYLVCFLLDRELLSEPPLQFIKAFFLNFLLGSKISKLAVIMPGMNVRQWENLKIGPYCLIKKNVTIDAQDKVSIGEGTILSTGVFITTGSHDLSSLGPIHSPVNIGKGVFVGARAIILPGVNLGDHSVIGAGAVVTKDIPALAVAIGVPAVVKKKRKRPKTIWTVLGTINISTDIAKGNIS